MTSTHLTGAIELPDGTRARGRGLRDPDLAGPLPDYGLYLGGRRARQVPLAARVDRLAGLLLPRDRADAVARVRDLHERARAGHRVEVGCHRGTGRTGTVLACLAVLAGIPADEAVTWARAHHDRRAAATPWQRRWVRRFPTS